MSKIDKVLPYLPLFIILLFIAFVLTMIYLGCGTNSRQVPLDSKTEDPAPFIPYIYKGPDSGPPFCGDGVCNRNEDMYTCMEDCWPRPRKEINPYLQNIPVPPEIKIKWPGGRR